MLVAGVLTALLTATVFGGVSRQGPHTNAGWLSLIVALMCLPFGLMLFALGAAKWFRNRRIARRGPRLAAALFMGGLALWGPASGARR